MLDSCLAPAAYQHAKFSAFVTTMEESESAALPQGVEGEEEGDIDFLDVLRNSWELASAIQFCRLFGGCLKVKPFSTEKLEAALLEPDDHSMFLAELLYKLLRRDTREPYTEREAFVWEDLLKRKLDAQWPQAFTAHPMPGGDFYTIDPLSRVSQLSLCAGHHPNITQTGCDSQVCCADEHFVRPVRVEA